jgi:hypothetical protein
MSRTAGFIHGADELQLGRQWMLADEEPSSGMRRLLKEEGCKRNYI